MLANDTFKDAVIEYLRPCEGNFNYENMLHGHLDTSRFEPWVSQVGQYRKIAGSTVLSSGCGSAGDLAEFLKSGAARVYGIEVSEGLASLARKRFKGTKWERLAQIHTYDGLKLPYNTDFFDIVFSMHVIEHTQDPALYLTESLRVLKPNGIIFLDVPNRYYRLEQHTLLPYLHFLPTRLRDMLIRRLLSRYSSAHLSKDTRYKLEKYIGIQFPTADQLIRICKSSQATYSLKLRDAFFHSYSNERVTYGAYPGKYLLGQAHRMTAFRMVVGKDQRRF